MEKQGIDWAFRQVTSLNLNYFWLKGSKVNMLVKYSLSRMRIKHRMCGVALHVPNCNAGQLVCIWPGKWNLRLDSQPGREQLLIVWRQNEASGMTKCAERNAFRQSQTDKKQEFRAQPHSRGGNSTEFPLLQTAKIHHQAIKKHKPELPLMPLPPQARRKSYWGHNFSAHGCCLLCRTDITRFPIVQAVVLFPPLLTKAGPSASQGSWGSLLWWPHAEVVIKLHLRPRIRVIMEKCWKHSHQLSKLQVHCTQSTVQMLSLWDAKRTVDFWRIKISRLWEF